MLKTANNPVEKVRQLQRRLWVCAKSSKTRRFHALYDRIYRSDVLWEAWKRVRSNKGAAGVDEITLRSIEEQGVTRFLEGIQAELKAGRYRPSPVKRRWIPKADGKQRPLGIPTVRDRVVQMAAKLVIEPIFEADFQPCSYGFRPKKSATQALEAIREAGTGATVSSWMRTSRVTSTAVGVPAEVGCALTFVVYGCIFMTYAARQRVRKSRAPQSRARPVAARRSTLRCGRTVGPRLLHFAASGLSLPRRSSATETAGPAQRSQTGIYRQTATQPGPARPQVCCSQRIVHQRGGQPSVARAAATRTRAWVSRNQIGNVPCSWNIDSTVCCRTSSRTCISYSSPIGASQWEERLRNKRIPQE
jgi:hypothetical protein